MRFRFPDTDEARYAHIILVAHRFGYGRLNRPDKGVVLRYRAPVHAFARRYTPADALLLAEVDRAHGTMSGPATVHLLRRALPVHGDAFLRRSVTIVQLQLQAKAFSVPDAATALRVARLKQFDFFHRRSKPAA